MSQNLTEIEHYLDQKLTGCFDLNKAGAALKVLVSKNQIPDLLVSLIDDPNQLARVATRSYKQQNGFDKIVLVSPINRDYRQEMGLSTDVEGLKRPIYLQYGLGTLLLGLSACILREQGVVRRRFVSTNKLAGRIWEAYGIETTSPIELSRITNHPTFKKIVGEFVGT